MTESKRPQKGRIFISYRRADTSYAAGRIYDRLVERFGEDAIFMDVDAIEGGVDFVKVLEDAVQSCDVLIALIGRQWLSIKDKDGNRRLDSPEDFVRIEIATALKRNIRVIPVLVDGVDMPQPSELPENLKALTRRNALQVNHHSFNPDVYRLIEHTASALDEAEESRVMKAQAAQSVREKAAKEKAEREAAEKLALEKVAREKAERDVVDGKTQEEIVEQLQQERKKIIDAALKKLKREKFKNNIQLRLQMIWIYRIPILILIFALAIIVPLSTDLLNKTPELAQTLNPTPSATNALSTPLIPLSKTTEPIQPSLTPTLTITPKENFTLTATSLPTEITDAKGVSMVLVPAGEFTMGSNANDYEKPIHQVFLDSYYIDKYETTNALYKVCVENGTCDKPTDTIKYNDPEYEQHPVVYVNWSMAQRYCEWRDTRLPTEAEWEKAARGIDRRIYPWGDYLKKATMNYGGNVGDTTLVGSYPDGVSPYGVYDMAGNVWEIVADWYDRNYYSSSPESNPMGPDNGVYRILRGGSWVNHADYQRSAFRINSYEPDDSGDNIGFRCAKDTSP